jgi:hypothetical protein
VSLAVTGDNELRVVLAGQLPHQGARHFYIVFR